MTKRTIAVHEQDEKADLIVRPDSATIRLNNRDAIDLSGLDENQVAELKRLHAAGLIDIHKKALEMKLDVDALGGSLGALNEHATKATQAGTHVTITHAQTTTIGRTEIVMGNTDRAASGKMSRSAAGERDITMWVVVVVAIAAAAVAIAALVR